MRVWTWLGASKCGKALPPEQRRWLDLFAAVAMRNAEGMATTGQELLLTVKGQRSEASEYALLATVTGLACIAEGPRARNFIDGAYQNWMRAGVRVVELSYLAAQSRRTVKCPARATD